MILVRAIDAYLDFCALRPTPTAFLFRSAIDIAFYLTFWEIFDFKALTEDEVCAMRRKTGEEMDPGDDEKIDGVGEQANQTTGEWSSIRRRTVTVGDHEH